MARKLVLLLLVFLAGYGLGNFLPLPKYKLVKEESEFQNGSDNNRNQRAEVTYENGRSEASSDEGYAQNKSERGNKERQSQTSDDENYSSSPKIETNGKVPAKVMEVLNYVIQNHEAPDGYVGGRRFKNLEQLLPKTTASGNRINYQEWDVNKKINGQNRGAERLVTGDDGSAYYTQNHYQSFIKLK